MKVKKNTRPPAHIHHYPIFFVISIILILIGLAVTKIYFEKSTDRQLPHVTTPSVRTITENFDNKPYTLTIIDLPPSTNLPDNLTSIGSVGIKIEDNQSKLLIRKLDKPITVSMKYDRRHITDCEQDEKRITAYVSYPTADAIIPLTTRIDTGASTIFADLPVLYPNDANNYTDVLFGVPASRFIAGCGDKAGAYLSGKRFIFATIGLSFLLPDSTKRPLVGGAEGINAVIPLPDYFPPTSKFTVETTTNPSNLPLEKLDTVTYGYEQLSPETFMEEDETITSKRVEQIGNISALSVTTTAKDTAKYYVYLENPNARTNGSLVYAFILSIPKESEATASSRAQSIMTTTIQSVQFLRPTL